MTADRLRAASGPLKDIWGWWTGELKSLVPGRATHERPLAKPYLLLTLDGEKAVLSARERSGDVDLGEAHLDESGGDLAGALDALAERRYRKQTIVVRLNKAFGLRKDLDLPSAARAGLDRLLFYELDRLTPFKADEVCFAWRILNEDRQKARLSVRMELAPKALIERILDAFAQHGRTPDRITLDGEDEGAALDLTPRVVEDETPKRGRLHLLPALVLGLAIIAVAVPLRQQMLTIRQLDAEIRNVRSAAEESGALRRQLQQLVDRSGFLVDRKNRYLPRTNVMAALTALIPDQAYINRMQIKGGRITVVGYADKASELIGALEQSPLFASPRFQSPLTRDPRTGKERFQIAVDLAWEGS